MGWETWHGGRSLVLGEEQEAEGFHFISTQETEQEAGQGDTS